MYLKGEDGDGGAALVIRLVALLNLFKLLLEPLHRYG